MSVISCEYFCVIFFGGPHLTAIVLSSVDEMMANDIHGGLAPILRLFVFISVAHRESVKEMHRAQLLIRGLEDDNANPQCAGLFKEIADGLLTTAEKLGREGHFVHRAKGAGLSISREGRGEPERYTSEQMAYIADGLYLRDADF